MKKDVILDAEDVENVEKATEMAVCNATNVEKTVKEAVRKSSSKRSMVSKQKDRKYLKYEFTKEEITAISEELARSVNEKDAVENELKSIKSQFDSRKKLAEEAISRCAKQISAGYEYRNIDVEIVKDFTLGTVTVWRLDTDEIVETRRMTGADRQMRIDTSEEEV